MPVTLHARNSSCATDPFCSGGLTGREASDIASNQ